MQVSAVERIDNGSKSPFLSLLQSLMKLDFSCREVYLKCCHPGTNLLPDSRPSKSQLYVQAACRPFSEAVISLKDAVRQGGNPPTGGNRLPKRQLATVVCSKSL